MSDSALDAAAQPEVKTVVAAIVKLSASIVIPSAEAFIEAITSVSCTGVKLSCPVVIEPVEI